MDSDILRKAVELADGWTLEKYEGDTLGYDNNSLFTVMMLEEYEEHTDLYRPVLDALAAQLVRQVDALPSPNPDYVRRTILSIWADSVSVIEFVGGTYEETATEFDDGDRTLNTITAIVESQVLETDVVLMNDFETNLTGTQQILVNKRVLDEMNQRIAELEAELAETQECELDLMKRDIKADDENERLRAVVDAAKKLCADETMAKDAGGYCTEWLLLEEALAALETDDA